MTDDAENRSPVRTLIAHTPLVAETTWIDCEEVRVGDVLINPHLGSVPPCRVTQVTPTSLIGGGVTIHYEHDDPSALDGVTKLTCWCAPGFKLEIATRK